MNSARLSLIMQHLHLSATELARAIHVHPSLVSRWKNGDRTLDNNSHHLNNITEYMIKRDELTNYKNIEVFLKQYEESDITSRDDAIRMLTKYLSTDEQYGHHAANTNFIIPQSGEIDIYQGGREKRQALLSFLELCLTFESGKTIYIMLGQDVNEFLEKIPFYSEWTKRLRKTVEHGNTIHFIYSYTYESIVVNLKNFYWLTSHDNFYAYSTVNTNISPDSGNVIILQDTFALCDFYTDTQDKRIPIFSFSEKVIVRQLEKNILSIINQSHLMREHDKKKNKKKPYSFIKKRIGADEPMYIYDESIFLFPVSLDIIKMILQDNDFTIDETMEYLEHYNSILYKPLLAKRSTFSKRFIINMDTMMETLKQEYYTMPSELIGDKDIRIKKSFYGLFAHEILNYLDKPLDKRGIEIAFMESQDIEENTGLMSIVKKNLFTLVYPYFTLESKHRSMLFTNNTLVTDAWLFYDNLWNNIAEEYKNDYSSKAILTDIIESF